MDIAKPGPIEKKQLYWVVYLGGDWGRDRGPQMP